MVEGHSVNKADGVGCIGWELAGCLVVVRDGVEAQEVRESKNGHYRDGASRLGNQVLRIQHNYEEINRLMYIVKCFYNREHGSSLEITVHAHT